MKIKCWYDSCRKVSPVEEWNEITKENNGDLFYPIDKCFEECEEQTELEGMAFYCPKCKQLNDGIQVEAIE